MAHYPGPVQCSLAFAKSVAPSDDIISKLASNQGIMRIILSSLTYCANKEYITVLIFKLLIYLFIYLFIFHTSGMLRGRRWLTRR